MAAQSAQSDASMQHRPTCSSTHATHKVHSLSYLSPVADRPLLHADTKRARRCEAGAPIQRPHSSAGAERARRAERSIASARGPRHRQSARQGCAARGLPAAPRADGLLAGSQCTASRRVVHPQGCLALRSRKENIGSRAMARLGSAVVPSIVGVHTTAHQAKMSSSNAIHIALR